MLFGGYHTHGLFIEEMLDHPVSLHVSELVQCAHENIMPVITFRTARITIQQSIQFSHVPHEQSIAHIHNIEMQPGKGGQIARAAGMSAQIMARDEKYVTIKMPSGEMRYILANCKATIGQVGNLEHEIIRIGKAGKTRYLGIRPSVRGVVMNPCDHPHGGGEGKSPVGMPSPVTPWGKPALGYKTRKHKKASNKLIITRIN